MKLFEKINLFLYRIDGLISLAVAVVSFVSLMQCALGVQNGFEILFLPTMVLLVLTVAMLTRFLDWLLLINRKTRIKAVERKMNTILKTWRIKKEDEKTEKE